MWCAVPEEALFYHLTRRHTHIETITDTPDQKQYRLSLENLPDRVTCRTITFEAKVPAPWCRAPRVWVDNTPHLAQVTTPGILRFTIDVADGLELTFKSTVA